MNKTGLRNLIKECFIEIKAKKAIRSLVNECLVEMGRRKKENPDEETEEVVARRISKALEGKDVVYLKDIPTGSSRNIRIESAVAKQLGYTTISDVLDNAAYVKNELFNKLIDFFSKSPVTFKSFYSSRIGDDFVPYGKDFEGKLEEVFEGLGRFFYGNTFSRSYGLKGSVVSGTVSVPKVGETAVAEEPVEDFSDEEPMPPQSQGEMPGDVDVRRVENPMTESKKITLKDLISEAMEEIKVEEKAKTLNKMIADLEKEISKSDDKIEIVQDDFGDYVVDGCPPHHFRIRHQYNDVFDVTYFKNKTDREKKINIKFEDLKKYVSDKVKNREGDYVQKEFNKTAENSKDVVKKESELPVNKTGVVVKKEVKDAEKEDKDYNEGPSEDAKDQSAPLKEVDKIKKQSEHSVKGEKADYEMPKQKDKKLTVKAGKTNRRFKGLPKGK